MRIWPLLLLLLAAALAGCIDEPRPFQPEAKPLPEAVAAGEHSSPVIVIDLVTGVDGTLARALADAMTRALERRSLPVAHGTAPPRGAFYRISGKLEAPALGAATITWEMSDSGRRLLARYIQRLPPGAKLAAPAVQARLVAEVADAPADAMSKGIEGDAPPPEAAGSTTPQPAAAPASGRSLVLGQITGAPAKDGNVALHQTISYALRTAGIRVVGEKAKDSLLLEGKVATATVMQDVEHVTVTWSVRRPDGTLLGEVKQENNVPSRLLQHVWGEIASAVAENAAPGIAALVTAADGPKTN